MPKLEDAARRVVEHYSTTLGEELATSAPRHDVVANDIQHLRKAMGLLGIEIATEGGDVLENARQLVAAAQQHLTSSAQPKASATPEVSPSPKEKKLQELSNRRESGALSPHDFDLNFIFQLNQANAPLTRRDLAHETGNQAVVLTRADFEALGCLDFIHSSGERMLIEPESLGEDDVLILYPEDLGDEEGKPSLRITDEE